MKTKKIFVVSILLLAILTLGAASAADDTTADLAVEDAGDLDLEVPADEITTDGDTEDVAVIIL